MTGNAPQSAALLRPKEQDRGIAAVVLLGVCILIAMLVAVGFGSDRVLPSGGRLVTVQDANRGTAAIRDTSLIGSTARGTEIGRQLGGGLNLVPRQVEGKTIGYIVGPASTAAALDIARLRVGDVLTVIDDRPLDDARVRGLPEELSTYDRVEIRFERNGHARKRTLDLTR